MGIKLFALLLAIACGPNAALANGPRTTRVRIVGLGFGDDEESKRMRAFFDRGNAFTLKKLQERFAPRTSDK